MADVDGNYLDTDTGKTIYANGALNDGALYDTEACIVPAVMSLSSSTGGGEVIRTIPYLARQTP